MVIERLHGPQTHYRAAQKFLKNRTLRKMNDTGMTLYERIMAYRKLKEGEEVSDDAEREELRHCGYCWIQTRERFGRTLFCFVLGGQNTFICLS